MDFFWLTNLALVIGALGGKVVFLERLKLIIISIIMIMVGLGTQN